MVLSFVVSSFVYSSVCGAIIKTSISKIHGSQRLRYENSCDSVCQDLPDDDREPVCMMFSRYKRGYQFYVNQCHARRAACKENLVLHMVHPSRCMKSNLFYMPVN